MIVVIEGPHDGQAVQGASEWLYLNEWELAIWDTDENRCIYYGQKRFISRLARELQRLAVERGFEDWDAAIPPPPTMPSNPFTAPQVAQNTFPDEIELIDDDEPF